MEIQASKLTISEQRECPTLFKRRAPNCKIKITIKESRLQGYLKAKGESYTPIALQGLPLDWRQRDVGRVRQFLERSYVKVHKGYIEVIQRGLGSGNNASTPVADKNVTAKQVIDVKPLLRKISDQRQREVIRCEVNKFLNHPEGKLLRLQEADIGPKEMQVLMTILKDNPSFQALDILDLYSNQIGDEGVKALAEALKKNPYLLQLDLSWNQIGDVGALALAGALKTNLNLQRLDLHINQIGNEGAKALAGALKKNLNLQRLDLHINQIGDEGAKALAGALKKNLNFLQLELWSNQIGDEGALALAGALKTNLNLQRLDLHINQIGDEGAKALAKALEKNLNLLQLDLGNNQIGDEGAKALAGALKKNLNLFQLDLENNQIGDEGANALAGALEKNLNLLQLNLSENQIGNSGTLALAGALKKNLNLLQLALRINDKGLRGQIVTLLQANRQIAAIFREQTEDLQTFIQSHENQLITEEENFLSFQKEIERQHEKLKTLRASLEEIIHQSGRTGLSKGYRKKIEAIEANLNSLLFKAFEDKLALRSQEYFSEESSEERKLTLGRSLYEIWTSFFGFQCPYWLKGKEQSLTTFCLLLSIAEGKKEASFDPPEMLFQRICQLNQPKL